MDGNYPFTSQDHSNDSNNTSTNVRPWPTDRPAVAFRDEGERPLAANVNSEINRPGLLREAPPISPQDPTAEHDPQPNDRFGGRFDPTPEPSKVEETAVSPPPRVTAAVVRIEERAGRLAESLNHPEVTLEHYVIAMTFENEGCEVFEQRKPELRKACLANLIGQPSVSEARAPVNFSQGVRHLKSVATKSAQRREGELQFVSVRDLSEALPSSMFDSLQAPLTMEVVASRLDRISSTVEDMQRQIGGAGLLARAQSGQHAAGLVDEAAELVQAQFEHQTTRLETLIGEFVLSERVAIDKLRRWTIGAMAVAGFALLSVGAAALPYVLR